MYSMYCRALCSLVSKMNLNWFGVVLSLNSQCSRTCTSDRECMSQIQGISSPVHRGLPKSNSIAYFCNLHFKTGLTLHSGPFYSAKLGPSNLYLYPWYYCKYIFDFLLHLYYCFRLIVHYNNRFSWIAGLFIFVWPWGHGDFGGTSSDIFQVARWGWEISCRVIHQIDHVCPTYSRTVLHYNNSR